MKPINLKFCAPFKIIWEGGTNLDKPVFDFSLLYPRKNGLRRKSKSGLRISHLKFSAQR